MTFHTKGFRSLPGAMGVPSQTASEGNTRQVHTFLTNDDAATVEAANYFDALLTPQIVKTGDLLLVSHDNDGTPRCGMYVITVAGGHVAISKEGAGAGKGLNTLAFYFSLPAIAAGDMLTNYVPGYNFKIESVDWREGKPVTTAAKLATINIEINTTDLTGGVVALTSATCTPAGVAVAGSAITAGNIGGPTDSFSIEASAVTAFVEGDGWLLIKIRNLDE
jgi:hypothetical protein